MKLNDEELARLYRRRTRRRGNAEACPSDELLINTASGKLGPRDREKVIQHLSICSDCATEYRLTRSLQLLSIQPAPVDAAAENQAGAHAATGASRWSFRAWSAAAPIWALAMSLLIATVAVGAWAVSTYRESQRLSLQVAARDRLISEARSAASETNSQISKLQRDLSALSEPQLNTPVIDLDPRDSVRDAVAHPSRTIQIQAQARMFTVILNIGDHRPFPDYTLDIVASGGGLTWSGQGLHRSAFDTFTITLPRSLLSDGQPYQFALYGLRGNKRELLENYRVRIQYQ